MILVDSNVLLYAANRESEHHRVAVKALEEVMKTGPWVFSWNLAYEFFRVSTHAQVFSEPLTLDEALSFIRDLLESSSCRMIGETLEHLETMATCAKETHRLRGNLVHDFHTAVMMREHGIKEILTFDRDFLAFPWVAVKQPR